MSSALIPFLIWALPWDITLLGILYLSSSELRAIVSQETLATTRRLSTERAWAGRVAVLIAKLIWYHDNEEDAPEKRNHYLTHAEEPAFIHQCLDWKDGQQLEEKG